ncbi:unnamed protein product, partial [Meganyctiphanes norvegica]
MGGTVGPLKISCSLKAAHYQFLPNGKQHIKDNYTRMKNLKSLGAYFHWGPFVIVPRCMGSEGIYLLYNLFLYHDRIALRDRNKVVKITLYTVLETQFVTYIRFEGANGTRSAMKSCDRFLPTPTHQRRKTKGILNGELLDKYTGVMNPVRAKGRTRTTKRAVNISSLRMEHQASKIFQLAQHISLTPTIKGYAVSTIHINPQPRMIYERSAIAITDWRNALARREAWENELPIENELGEDHGKNKWTKTMHNNTNYNTHNPTNRRVRRSVSVERNVEVLVVADRKMLDFYDSEDINTYILTVMNMVSLVYHDASIGNAVNILVVRIMLLEDPQYEEELDISHNADNTLRSFCKWQHMVNPSDENHPNHHDVAVLITRYNICSEVRDRCSTLGVAEIAGMCHPERSCNVNEDTGLQLAYTIAHEIGHNFGMAHDGPHNHCESLYGINQHVMSPQLNADPLPLTWSNCSRKDITDFLDRDWGRCLEDMPPAMEYSFPRLPPGAMYDANHQCRLQFGPDATHCDGIEKPCQTLWCRIDNRCVTRLEPAVEGTKCGKHQWCSLGECVMMGERQAAIHGNWGNWSEWSTCSRSCGAGISVAERHCDNPAPANGGTYCIGDRKKYKICNTQTCEDNTSSFRANQCSEFDDVPYKAQNHTWLPVLIEDTPCSLHCKPDNEFYSVELKSSVVDGTPCRPGTRDMCINAVCKRVACDWSIQGEAQEDRCGLCHGDGTQCTTTRGNFTRERGTGYLDIVQFPIEARNVRIEEQGEAANYLAIRDDLRSYYLNGDWVIQWSGEYLAASSMLYYNREGEMETIFIPGPLKRPLTLAILWQTENPGVTWQYTTANENATYTPTFSWKHSEWSVCSSSCGGGQQISKVQCMEAEAGLVEDKYCRGSHINSSEPKDKARDCNTHACPAWWWSGPWQPCSVTCGSDGTRRRTVICVNSYGPTQQMALLDSDCPQDTRPYSIEACVDIEECPKNIDWHIGAWSQDCGTDPCDYENREVGCMKPYCDPLTRPAEMRYCGNITCGTWQTGNWSKCSSLCGDGVQFRKVSCIGGLACREKDEPSSVQECTAVCNDEIVDDDKNINPKRKNKNNINNIDQEQTLLEDIELVDKDITINEEPSIINIQSTTEALIVNSTIASTPSTKIINTHKALPTTIQSISTTTDNTDKISTTTVISSTTSVTHAPTSENTILSTTPITHVTTHSPSVSSYVPTSATTSTIMSTIVATASNISTTLEDKDMETSNAGTANSKAGDNSSEKSAQPETTTHQNSITTTQTKTASQIEEAKETSKELEKADKNISEDQTINEIDLQKNKLEIGVDPKDNHKNHPKNKNIYNKDYNKKYNEKDNVKENKEHELSDNIVKEDKSFQTTKPEYERPEGIIEDKFPIDDFQLIEVVQTQKKKHHQDHDKNFKNKKILIHTGKDAIDVINDILQKSDDKKLSTTVTATTTLPLQYEWSVGEWSECSSVCGGGLQSRPVECQNKHTHEFTEPSMCEDEPPSDLKKCAEVKCSPWTIGLFGPCSAVCGIGNKTRSIECDKDLVCHPDERPPEYEQCEVGPCVRWVEGPWSMCTKSCGKGYRIRHVKCVDVRSGETISDCPKFSKPKHKESCNTNACDRKSRRGQVSQCRDSLKNGLCSRLKHMCVKSIFRIKCCRTCRKFTN